MNPEAILTGGWVISADESEGGTVYVPVPTPEFSCDIDIDLEFSCDIDIC